MSVKGFVKVGGQWRTITDGFVKVAGQWRTATDSYVKVVGRWRGPDAPPPALSPGTYVISAATLYLPTNGNNGYATFDTTQYQGSITEVKARVSWRSPAHINGLKFGMLGRTSGNWYRDIDLDEQWYGRTIDHGISSYDAAAVTEFNNGSATGFTIDSYGLSIGSTWSNVQLVLVIG